jgi:hypothetical protein
MSHYILIRRLRGPVLLLLVGVLALLHQAHIIDHFWHLFWPLLMITFGLLLLAERAVLSAERGYPSAYPGAPYCGAPDPSASTGAPQNPAQPETAIVRSSSSDFGNDPKGGQS